MITSLFILLPLLATALWAFFRFSPTHADSGAVRRFNAASLAVAVLLAIAWALRTYIVMKPTADSAWWPFVSLLGAPVIVTAVLAAAALARHLAVFPRSPKQPFR